MSNSKLGLKRDHSSSELANAWTLYHKHPKKATNVFDKEDYSQTLRSKCNKSSRDFANFILITISILTIKVAQ